MKKEDKNLIISQLQETLKEFKHFYIVDSSELDAEKTSQLRRTCFKEDIKLVVVKNTLFQKALEGLDGDFSSLFDVLKGSTSIMFSNNANSPAKLIKKYSNDKIFIIEDVKDAFGMIEKWSIDKEVYALFENDLPDLYIK